jgi:hypothetical protein
MTGDQAKLSNLNEKKTSIKMKTSNYVHLSNVLYVPGLEKNLVSISCL